MSTLLYAKLHACGNDFLVVAQEAVAAGDEQRVTQALCARTSGVGADGVEFLRPEGLHRGTIRLRNADGGVAEISGNGTRCVAAWMAHQAQAAAGETFTLDTDAGARSCTLARREGTHFEFRQGMGIPVVSAAALTLPDGTRVEGAVVLTGNPHFVIRVQDESFASHGQSWEELGRAVCFHPDFPGQTNVEFVQVLEPGDIAIRIFERGVGPTSSSGTGTCASAAAAMRLYGCLRELAVHAPGGTQQVSWSSDNSEMELTGPATLIATGEAFLPAAGEQR